MNGKLMGAALGLLTGGPLGAFFGILVGHVYDGAIFSGGDSWSNTYARFSGTAQQSNFTVGVIVLGAKMAKADGRVTRAEVEAFKRVFNVTPAQESQVGKLFNKARTSATGFEPFAFQLSNTFRQNPTVLAEILGGLFVIAASDTAGLSTAELTFLKSVGGIFGISSEDFVRIAARAGVSLGAASGGGTQERPADDIGTAYEIIGVTSANSPEEIKAAYRALIREHHPDRLMAQGVPAEFINQASEKMKRINVAYGVISKEKNIK